VETFFRLTSNKIGKMIKWVRRKLKLNQTDFAKKIGTHQSEISLAENGDPSAVRRVIKKLLKKPLKKLWDLLKELIKKLLDLLKPPGKPPSAPKTETAWG